MLDGRFENLPHDDQQEFLRIQEALDALAQANPLLRFHACRSWCGSPECPAPSERNPQGGRPKQYNYMAAMERIVLLAAGNRMGKTTANVVWAIIQHTPDELLPDRLKEFRRPRPAHAASQAVAGRYIAPSEKALNNIVLPELQRWIPPSILRGKRWDKAYTDKGKVLYFHDGGRLEFYTSEQDPKVMVGTALDYVIIDEPTTKGIWGENWVRLTTRRGTARFGLTPVNMTGGGIGWLYHDIYRPGVLGECFEGTDLVPRILRAEMDDNPDLTDQDIAEALAIFEENEREARRTGEFVAFGGLVYPNFRKYVVPLSPDNPDHQRFIRRCQTIVGIDPSYRRAAFVWVAFDDANRGIVYHVEYVHKGSPLAFRDAIARGNRTWGIRQQPLYVMDPYAGGQHSMLAGSTVTIKSELQTLGIATVSPKIQDSNAIVYGGVSNIWRRMEEGSFHVASCVHPEFLLEAEEYRTEDRPDGVFEVVKEFDDGMDACRYAFTQRPWYPRPESYRKHDSWRAGHAPDWSLMENSGPMAEYPSATGMMT
ncbi:MAG TPA: hypothetical protein VFG50_01010 [Rhodothermales bacterium]|nr:hypothetical protein [Rhodothermales bacterium]